MTVTVEANPDLTPPDLSVTETNLNRDGSSTIQGQLGTFPGNPVDFTVTTFAGGVATTQVNGAGPFGLDVPPEDVVFGSFYTFEGDDGNGGTITGIGQFPAWALFIDTDNANPNTPENTPLDLGLNARLIGLSPDDATEFTVEATAENGELESTFRSEVVRGANLAVAGNLAEIVDFVAGLAFVPNPGFAGAGRFALNVTQDNDPTVGDTIEGVVGVIRFDSPPRLNNLRAEVIDGILTVRGSATDDDGDTLFVQVRAAGSDEVIAEVELPAGGGDFAINRFVLDAPA